ncbi:hypothetical protein KM043_000316 [Ampulex compressa]|nr:hypothetical protein KM043_000316 [Ampulex compressa]
MSNSAEDAERLSYDNDARIPCKYGAKCYQRNTTHHSKYKHPAKRDTDKEAPPRQLKRDDEWESTDANENAPKKRRRVQPSSAGQESRSISPCLSERNTDASAEEESDSLVAGHRPDLGESLESVPLGNRDLSTGVPPTEAEAQRKMSTLFMTEMPDDFFQFFKLCKNISKDDPIMAFKDVSLKLVGPYDIFRGAFDDRKINKERLLRHWRYYYDPPEFLTVIKGDDADGLHFGYWKDDLSEKPVFVAKNKAEVDCKIEPVAENIFGAVAIRVEEKLRSANPFQKTPILRLQRELKRYAKENDITLEKNTSGMRDRERKVVARTFHSAGIVVPYNKKTQLGYRDLAVTDSELKKILKLIKDADTPEERRSPMTKLEEVVRLATIAADECDFGTCLELGQDLFSSGVVHVQHIALEMLSIAYTHLQRPELLEIARAHFKDRKRGSKLSVV